MHTDYMEKKKNIWNSNSLWAFSRFRNIYSFILGRNYSPKNNTRAGFTLIELLITIAIVGVLAVGLVTVLNPFSQIQKAQDAKRKSDLSQIQKALEIYYQDRGEYPEVTASGYKIKRDGNPVEWGSEWLPYMSILPKDPSSSKQYLYKSTAQTYYIYASLDKGTNNPGHVPGGAACGSGITCNYGVSSPNVSP